jgi:hypothetical protein
MDTARESIKYGPDKDKLLIQTTEAMYVYKTTLWWKSTKNCIFVRVCACEHGWVRACVRLRGRVALLIQYALRRQIVICSPSGSNKFFDFVS